MKLLLYCTKAKPYIMKYKDGKYKEIASFYSKQDLATYDLLNGKIVAECDFEVEEITIGRSYGFNPNMCIISTKNLQPIELLSKSCYESYDDLLKYLKYDFDNDYGNHKKPYGYAIHIRNLHIFSEEERENNVYRNIENGKPLLGKTMQEVGIWEIYDPPVNGPEVEHFVGKFFIPVSPQEMCRIANKEQTVIPRKKVLKEMLE